MTIEYFTQTENLLNRINYGMPSFGVHNNYFVNENSLDNSIADNVVEYAVPQKDQRDFEFLDSLLNGIDGKERTKVIEDMISERETIKIKFHNDIENAKDNLRSMKYIGSYTLENAIPVKDMTKLYNDLIKLSKEEEIKAWKDISFLRVKLWDEGLGGEYNESPGI